MAEGFALFDELVLAGLDDHWQHAWPGVEAGEDSQGKQVD